MYRLKAFEHTVKGLWHLRVKHTPGSSRPPADCRLLPQPSLCPCASCCQCWESSGTKVAARGSRWGGPGDPVLNHPQPIPACETGVLLAQGTQRRRHFGRSNPTPPHPHGCCWPWGCSASLSCLHQGQIGPRCKLLVSGVGSLLPARGKGYRVQTAGNMPATLLGMSVGAAYPSALPPHPLPFPIPAPCLSPSLRHKPAGDREGDQACEMAGNLPTPACSSLAILLTSPSPERIDASAFELL